MKKQPLHPEHRFRRLIIELRKAIRMSKLTISIFPVIVSVFFLYQFISMLFNPRFLGVGLVFLVVLTVSVVLGSILNSILSTIFRNYSSILIKYWLYMLFEKYWICYLLDYTVFELQTTKENRWAKNISRFNFSTPKPVSAAKHKFSDFYVSLVKLNLMTQKVFKLNPAERKTTLIKWISEDKQTEFGRNLLVYIGTMIPLFLIFIPITLNRNSFFEWIFPLMFMATIFIISVIIRPALAKIANKEVLKAILCALYLRDSEHEITDQRVLGIPSYIDYKSLVQQVDSYMIDSKLSSGAEQL